MKLTRVALVILVVGLLTGSAQAQVSMGSGGGGGGAYALDENERNLKFAGIPIPGYDDVMGWNIGVVGMAYYKMDRHDDDLPPSATGVFGFWSENKSWMGGLFQKFHLDEDNWRITAAYGQGSIKYQFNPSTSGPGFPDVFVDYSQAMNFFFAQGARRIQGRVYAGLGLMTWEAKVALEPNLVETPTERYTGPGFVAEWDKRNHVMYPTDGFQVEGRMMFFDDTFGSDRDFQRLSWSASAFEAMGDTNRVLAGRLQHTAGFNDVPFSAEAIMNGNQNLRGYSNGRYRAKQLLMVETEYRWMFHGRWGAAVFGGLGWVADRIDKMSLGDTLPAVGLGVRFRIIEAYKINARIDYGWGKDDQAIYFAIGEAF